MRILGKGITAQAIKQIYKEAILYDDNDIDSFDFDSDELSVVSPGIPPDNKLVKNCKNLISDYDLLLSNQFQIWISGTNGKTTTTQMIYHLLKQYNFKIGGNIGIPLANIYQNNRLILETSSFTLHYTKKAKPNIYVLLPITPDHISWHQNFDNYEKAKLSVLDRLEEGDIAIIPQKYHYITSKGLIINYKDENDLAQYFNINIQQLNFKKPFLLDAILAIAVYKILLCNNQYDLNSFVIDEHKLEEIKDKNGNLWINDSKATNIDATIQALKNFINQKIFLIIGGVSKGQDFNVLFNVLTKYNITLFLIGENAPTLYQLSKKYNLKAYQTNTIKKTIKKIKSILNDEIVLFSPACASFDQFKSYKHRGQRFKKLL
jgi:UDP-N-acetylmuramoylalanine--D-glutamate ligase